MTEKKLPPKPAPRPMVKKVLDPEESLLLVKKSISEMSEMYKSDPRQNSFNALILGEQGSGKSHLMLTAKKPVHVDSFDPGGTKGVRDLIKTGAIIADTRYEAEDPLKPSAFKLWKQVITERIRIGYFNHIGTYFLDGSTTWSEAIMNDILRIANLAGHAPRWAHDYVPQKVEIRNWIRLLLDLPCDFVLTGHLEGHKDEVAGGMSYRFMTTGKGVVTLPLLFDEIYVMDPKDTSTGTEYRILTQSTGRHVARSRLSKGGLLNKHEKADIKNILKKANMPTEDKPLLT